jgi:hypothetical protein
MARRIRRRLESSGVDDEQDPLHEDDPLMALLRAASVLSWVWRRAEASSRPLIDSDGGSRSMAPEDLKKDPTKTNIGA